MKGITHVDANADARRAWLFSLQSAPAPSSVASAKAQSNFEKSFALRLAFVAAIVVIAINLFDSASPPVSTAPSNHAKV